MRKFFLLLIIFLTLPLFTVSAQQKNERWVCLMPQKAGGHIASLSVNPQSKLLPTNNTYIFECLSTSECTSGNPQLDQQVFGKNNYAEMQSKYKYSFENTTLASNPIMSDASGEIVPFTWQSSTSSSHERRWLALNYYEPVPSINQGQANTQQQGTFTLEEVFNETGCGGLSWDPYGRVFDSKTLEPVNNASVSLLIRRADGTFSMMTTADLLGGKLLNPQTTKEDGGFSFVVPDGIYKLSVTQAGYTFPEQLVNIQHNYSRIYSDIYPGQTGEEIVQAGIIQHKDIPLAPILGSQTNEAKLMEYFYDLDKSSSTLYINGRVSHPFAQINAYSLKPDPTLKENVRYRLLTKKPVIADKLGSFILKINQSGFEPDEYFGEITIKKVDLTQAANLVKKIKDLFFSLVGRVNAQTILASSFRFEPIPNYLEGYAYDSQGKVIPDATVSIILDFSNKPSYQVKADENGYFKVTSEFLPSMSYHINYTTPAGQAVTTSTSEFIVQNQDLIKNSQIKINQFKNENGKIITRAPTTVITANNLQGGTTENSVASAQKMENPPTSKMILLILAIIVLFIITVIIIFLTYIKRRKEVV